MSSKCGGMLRRAGQSLWALNNFELSGQHETFDVVTVIRPLFAERNEMVTIGTKATGRNSSFYLDETK
jgi:S-formylglutathione hydrolase FrmB